MVPPGGASFHRIFRTVSIGKVAKGPKEIPVEVATVTSKFKRTDDNALAQGPELMKAAKDQKNIDMLPEDTEKVIVR